MEKIILGAACLLVLSDCDHQGKKAPFGINTREEDTCGE